MKKDASARYKNAASGEELRYVQTNEVAARDLVKDAPDLCGRIGAQIGGRSLAPGASLDVEGVPWWRYRPLWLDAEDISGTALQAVTYIAQGDEDDRNPSLRYLTL